MACDHHPTEAAGATSYLSVLLLAPTSLQDRQTLQTTQLRIQRFANSSPNLLIILQLHAPPPSSFITARQMTAMNGTTAYMQLQTLLINDPNMPHMPILLLSKPEDIAKLLNTYITSLAGSRSLLQSVSTTSTTTTPLDLLRMCTLTSRMREDTAYYITDLFTGLGELAAACIEFGSSISRRMALGGDNSVPSSDGMGLLPPASDTIEAGERKLARLRALVDETEFYNLVRFWANI